MPISYVVSQHTTYVWHELLPAYRKKKDEIRRIYWLAAKNNVPLNPEKNFCPLCLSQVPRYEGRLDSKIKHCYYINEKCQKRRSLALKFCVNNFLRVDIEE